MSKRGKHGVRNPKKSQRDRKKGYDNERRHDRGDWGYERGNEDKNEWRKWVQTNKPW